MSDGPSIFVVTEEEQPKRPSDFVVQGSLADVKSTCRSDFRCLPKWNYVTRQPVEGGLWHVWQIEMASAVSDPSNDTVELSRDLYEELLNALSEADDALRWEYESQKETPVAHRGLVHVQGALARAGRPVPKGLEVLS